ncbi:tyrosine-type recombinase/integrase [Candidatus Micrarchaeota archaeon]|nr:tyrosine-type recombinase/integrase [Candidatus Micrarchaeota archaeon]
MVDKYDVYGLQAKFPRILANFKQRKDLLPENREDIGTFEEYLGVENLSASRKIKYLRSLTTLSKIYGMPFRDASRKDLEPLFIKISNGKHTLHTIKDFKVALKKFFKWLRGTSDYPVEVNWLKTSMKEIPRIDPAELITADELNRLESFAKDLEMKVLLRILYYSAARPSEILTLTRSRCRFDQTRGFLIIKVQGKTGEREIPIYDKRTIDLFSNWLNFRGNIENGAFVFPNRKGKMLEPSNLRTSFSRIFKDAGINKPSYPYAMRHSRITQLSDELTDQQLKQFSGWAANSRMASTYVHRDIDDLLRAFDRYSPKKKEDAEKQIEKEASELLAELFSHRDVIEIVIDKIKEHSLFSKFEKLKKDAGIPIDRIK